MRNLVNIFKLFLLLLIFDSCSTTPGTDEKASSSGDTTRRSARNYYADCKKLFSEAKKMDSILYKQNDIDFDTGYKAIRAFGDFANYCHNDSLSPVFLIKLAQVARALNNIPQAKLALDRCIEEYPSFSNRPAAIFLLAQLYDEPTYLNNEAEAKRLYQKIIDEHPKSEWATSARGAINFIGKTDEEILMEIKKGSK
jgi:outer membrane protein assembly factor BamD (BamD/ComL family)